MHMQGERALWDGYGTHGPNVRSTRSAAYDGRDAHGAYEPHPQPPPCPRRLPAGVAYGVPHAVAHRPDQWVHVAHIRGPGMPGK